jgi:hypothetical protein
MHRLEHGPGSAAVEVRESHVRFDEAPPVNAHVAPAELLEFLRGSLGADRERRVVSHLAGCAPCRRALGTSLAPAREARSRSGHPAAARPPAGGAAQPAHRRPGAGRVRRLLEGCALLRHDDPWEALRLADLARQAALRLAPGRSGTAGVVDWMSRATAELGNAYRLTGELAAAERCLRQALALAGRGSGDPRLLAAIADLAASLLADQRRFAAALAILERVRGLYQRLDDPQLAARALLSQSLVLSYAGEAERALPVLLAALAEIDAARAPHLAAQGLHNLAKLLVDLGRPDRAHHVVETARSAGRLSSAPVDLLRLRWLEGRIAVAFSAGQGPGASRTIAGQGPSSASRGAAGQGPAGASSPSAAEREAEAAFREATAGFAAAGLVYPAALAALDLAAFWVRVGRRREAGELLAWAIATFRRLGIAREAISALLLLRRLLAENAASNEALLTNIRRAAARLGELEAKKPRRPPAR